MCTSDALPIQPPTLVHDGARSVMRRTVTNFTRKQDRGRVGQYELLQEVLESHHQQRVVPILLQVITIGCVGIVVFGGLKLKILCVAVPQRATCVCKQGPPLSDLLCASSDANDGVTFAATN